MKYAYATGLALAGLLWSSSGAADDPATQPTTLYLVRHAEKMSEDRDPELSPAGKQRAVLLDWMLQHVTFDAVFSSDYKRTRATVATIANKHGVQITAYAPHKNLATTLQALPAGHTAIVSGHSNTIPQLLQQLGVPIGEKILDGYEDLFIVTLSHTGHKGQRQASMQRLQYGNTP